MSQVAAESLLFVAEYFDAMAQLKRKYLLKYFPESHSAEMVDVKQKKLFLKRSPCPPQLQQSDFAVGNKILLYSRELEIIDYGDSQTRQRLFHQTQKALAILTSDATSSWGEIIEALEAQQANMSIVRLRTIQLSDSVADQVCRELELTGNARRIRDQLTKAVSLLVVIQSEGGTEAMASVLSQYSSDSVLLAGNGSQVSELSNLLFGTPSTATLDSCTCCLIKPHAVKARNTGAIISIIQQQGYEISAMDSFHMSQSQAEEFLQVYRGVVPEYKDHVIQLCSGTSVVMEIRAQDSVQVFRETAGPWDIEMAKELRPESIRAKFGVDKIMSAVHCTDLPTDGALECQFCFNFVN